jgi:hypothetical protein
MGKRDAFRMAVEYIAEHVSFDEDNVVSLFEVNIRWNPGRWPAGPSYPSLLPDSAWL